MNRSHRSWTVTGAIRHHLAVLVLVLAVAVAAAGLAATLRPPTYEASALLFLDGRANSSQGFDLALQASELLSSHYVQIATSGPVLASTCDTLRREGQSCSPESLATRVSAGTVRGTSMIAVSGRAGDPRSAAALANAAADAVIKENRAEVDDLAKPTAGYLDSQLKSLSAQIAQLQATVAQLSNDPSPAARGQELNAQSQLAVLQGQYTNAYQRKQDLVLSQYQMEGALSLYERAVPPLRPADPNPLLYLSAGLLVGVLAGLALVVLLERFDDRLYSVEDLVEATGSVLGLSVPRAGRGSDSQHVRYYALARAHLLAQRPDLRCLVVAAAGEGDKAHPVAVALGAVAARAGQTVLVLSAEDPDHGVRAPGPPAGAGGNGSTNGSGGQNGLKVVRRSRARIARERLAGGGLEVVRAAGDGSSSPVELVDSGHDLTVVAAPPPYSNATGIYLAASAELAVVVATARSTTFRDAQKTSEALSRAGIPVVAAILVGAPPRGYSETVELHAEVLEPLLPGTPAPLPSWRGPTAP